MELSSGLPFPREILSEIISSLSGKNLISACQSNSQLYLLCNDEEFWKRLYQRDYNFMNPQYPSSFKKSYYYNALNSYPIKVYLRNTYLTDITGYPNINLFEYVKEIDYIIRKVKKPSTFFLYQGGSYLIILVDVNSDLRAVISVPNNRNYISTKTIILEFNKQKIDNMYIFPDPDLNKITQLIEVIHRMEYNITTKIIPEIIYNINIGITYMKNMIRSELSKLFAEDKIPISFTQITST